LIGSTEQVTDLVRRLRLVDCVARGLQLLHAAWVAHRDVKPSNVLLSGDDVHLADLGLCLPVDDEARLTETSEAVGSRLYIAPENESGFSEDVDQRPADVYGWAKLAWAVIASRNPPARELLVQSGYRLEALLRDDRLAGLNPLFERLDTDPRTRLTDWTVVRGELSAILSLYEERAGIDVAESSTTQPRWRRHPGSQGSGELRRRAGRWCGRTRDIGTRTRLDACCNGS
jgi:serine/threonine protein kinase